jgi:hypothetical protein
LALSICRSSNVGEADVAAAIATLLAVPARSRRRSVSRNPSPGSAIHRRRSRGEKARSKSILQRGSVIVLLHLPTSLADVGYVRRRDHDPRAAFDVRLAPLRARRSRAPRAL